MIVPAYCGIGRINKSLGGWVGLVPSQFNMVNGQNFSLVAVSTNPPGGWVGSQIAITSGQVAPDGATTATKLTDNDAGVPVAHFIEPIAAGFGIGIGQGLGEATNIKFRYAVIAKQAEHTRIVLRAKNKTTLDHAEVGFDLAGGQVFNPTTTAGITIFSTSIVQKFNSGWYLCILDITPTATLDALEFNIILDNGAGAAAQSTSYTGTPGSGVYVWYASLMPLAAWTQFSRVTFFDDFTSTNTVDMTNSRVDGFNWYLQTSWPGSGLGGCWQLGHPTPTSSISQTGSLLTLLRDQSSNNNTATSGGCGNTMASAAASISGDPTQIVGRQFLFPAIIEWVYAFEQPLMLPSGGFTYNGTSPAFWCLPAGLHTGPYGQSPGDNFGYEIDFNDTPAMVCNTSISPSQIPLNQITYGTRGLGSTGAPYIPQTITDFKQQAYMLFNATSETGGKGFALSFCKGTSPTDARTINNMFIPTTMTDPVGTVLAGSPKPWDSTAVYYTDPFYLIMGAGYGVWGDGIVPNVTRPVPTAWDWIRVIQ